MNCITIRNAGTETAKIKLADGKLLNILPRTQRVVLANTLDRVELDKLLLGQIKDCYGILPKRDDFTSKTTVEL